MSIRVELELDDGSFTTRMIHAGETVRQFERNVGQGIASVRQLNTTSRDFLSTMRDVSVVIGMAGQVIGNIRSLTTGWIGDIVKVNAEMERMTKLMEGMSTAADPVKEAADNVKKLRDVAKEAPYSINAITEAFTRLKAGGLSGDAPIFKGLIDGVAAMGGSEDVLKRASVAIQQMAGKGVIQMEELRQQLGEAMPRATELMARVLGTTYNKLISDIGTGTVQAKPALEALGREFERTFGGAAAAQMKTFNGQLQQVKTNMQNFALRVGGEGTGFFEALKAQLKDFNDLLSSSQVETFATRLGTALTSGVGFLRNVIEWVVEFRTELVQAAQVLAVAFGTQMAINGVVSLTNALGTAITTIRAFGISANAVSNSFAGLGGVVMGVRSIGDAMTAANLAAGALARTIPMVMMGLSTIGGILPAVAGLVLMVGDYFGVFSNRAKDAWQELERFGNVSRETLEKAKPFLAQQDAKIRSLEGTISAKKAGYNAAAFNGGSLEVQDTSAEEAELAREIEKRRRMREQAAQWEQQAIKNEADKKTRVVMEQVTDQERAISLGYDQRSIAAADAFKKEMDQLTAAKKSTVSTEKAYQEERRRLELDYYDQRLAMLKTYSESASELMLFGDRTGDDQMRATGERTLAEITRQVQQVRQMREQVEKSGAGVPKSDKQLNEDKLLEKSTQNLNKMKAELVSNRAELAGFSGEVAKLQFELIELQKAGPIDNAKIKENIDNMIALQEQITKTNEQLKGQGDLDRDIKSANQKLREEIFELETKGMSSSDKLRLRIQQGFYPGATKSGLQTTVEGVKTAVNEVAEAARTTSSTIMSTLLGGSLMEQMGKLVEMSAAFKNNLTGAGSAAAGVTLPGAGGGSGGAGLAGVPQGPAGADWAQAIRWGAEQIGANARDLAALISFESGFSTTIKGGAGGRHLGAIQFGTSEQEKYGVSANQSIIEQMRSVVAYMKDRGYKPGMSVLDLYSTVNAGRPGLYDASDTKNGGTWGTVKDKVEKQWGPHYARADALLGGNSTTAAGNPLPNPATNTPSIQPRFPGDSRLGNPDGLDPKTGAGLNTGDVLQQRKNQLEADQALSDAEKKVAISIAQADENALSYGKRVAEIKKQIRDGVIDKSNLDPESDRYKHLIELAGQWDKADEKAQKAKKARSTLDRASEKRKTEDEDIDLKAAQLKRDYENDGTYKKSFSNGFFRKIAQQDKDDDAIRAGLKSGAYNSEQAATAERLLSESAGRRQRWRDEEVNESLLANKKKLDDDKRSLMTADEARQDQYQKDVNRLRAIAGDQQVSDATRARSSAQLSELQRVHAAALAANSPIGKQMKEWADLGNNMQKAMTGWLDSAVDGIAEFVVKGKMDFKSLIQSIEKDIIKMGLKSMISKSGVGNMLGGGASKVSGAGGGAGKAAGGGMGKLFGAHHTGGIVGSPQMTRFVNPKVFMNAPKFHTGGIIGGLTHGEVPIIAKRGEGVFTPEQMAAMGGSNVTQVNTPISVAVNANGHMDEKQSGAVGDQIGKALENHVRGIIGTELRKQRRPGGTLNPSMA